MAVQDRPVLNAEQLNDADEQILDVLREGRATPALVSDVADLGRSYVSQRLIRLEEHGNVDELVRGLYELRYDPRESNADAGDGQRRLRESVEALKDKRDDLQDELDDAYERIHELEEQNLKEQNRQAAVDADRARQALDRALDELPDDAPGRLAVADAREMLREDSDAGD